MKSPQQGFTLIELMIVVAILAIIASMAIPSLLSSKVAANQSNAVTSLRNLVTAQSQFRTLGSVDADSDGSGEYGTFAELSGAVALNLRGGAGVPFPLDPPILAPPFEQVDAQGRATKSGYYLMIFLPDVNFEGIAEAANGGPAAGIDADACEYTWSAYAFPVEAGSTGGMAYYIDHRGEILVTRMDSTIYDSSSSPVFNAALSGPNMTSPLAIDGNVATDTNSWAPL